MGREAQTTLPLADIVAARVALEWSAEEITTLRAALLGLVVEFSGRTYDGEGNVLAYYASLETLGLAFAALHLPNPCPVSELPVR